MPPLLLFPFLFLLLLLLLSLFLSPSSAHPCACVRANTCTRLCAHTHRIIKDSILKAADLLLWLVTPQRMCSLGSPVRRPPVLSPGLQPAFGYSVNRLIVLTLTFSPLKPFSGMPVAWNPAHGKPPRCVYRKYIIHYLISFQTATRFPWKQLSQEHGYILQWEIARGQGKPQ